MTQPQPFHWHSVEDKLPRCPRRSDSYGPEVLIWPRDVHLGCGATAYFGRRLSSEPCFYKYGAVLHGITHWAPLPEGPK